MKIEDLKQLFYEQLRDLHDAEGRLVKALPKMAKAAHNADLKAGFEEHLAQTKVHVERLDQIFKTAGEKATGKTCKAMQGLVAEGEETMSEDATPEVMDAALIAAAQRVEHYEMAGYGTVMAYAKILGEKEAVKLLKQTLTEEKQTDEKLSELAETVVNIKAS